MDISTLIGLIAGSACIIVAILLSGNLMLFVDIQSILIVFGGAVSSLLIAYPLPAFMESLKTIKYCFRHIELDTTGVMKNIDELAQAARKEGLLALEEMANNMNEPFLHKGIQLIVDGSDPEMVRNILETEISFIETRHKDNQAFWTTLAELGPAWGMIGTLIGLIAMLDSLNDPTTLGPKMSVALITTLYGTILANFIATPMANKLKVKSDNEILLKQLMVEGLISLQAGENPRVIEEKLKAFLSPEVANKATNKDQEVI